MSIDYGEIFCNAVDEIITSKLQGLQYDITKLCTIIDDTYSNQGKYIVSDGAARYEAFSTDINLRKGNNVLVLIPNGDYSMQKNITGRVVASDTTPFNYTSPMDTMIKITNNVFNNSIGVQKENIGLLANDEGRSTTIGPIYSITETGDFAGFTRLGITANFRSWLNGLDVVEGIYGLKILIYTEVLNTPGSTTNAVYELTFSSADMIGNPYQFESYFYQEKVFDISNINNIKQIDVYFYQNGQFKDGSGQNIPWQEDIQNNIGLEPSKKSNNLFVNDVQIFLGYEAGAFTDETLMLYTPDSLSYHYTNENSQKNVSLRWIHKIDEKNFELLNSKNLDKEKFQVHWFRYNPGFQQINQYAGKDWEEVSPDANDIFSYSFIPNLKKQKEQIKVIGLINEITGSDENGNNIYSLIPYYSNLLVFENEENIPDDITVEVSTALSIVCTDNSEGNYYIYNQNGKINNEGIGRGYTRYLKAMYQGAEITSSIGKLDWIKWYFPTESTMIIGTNSFYTENGGKVSNEIVNYKGVDYKVITRTSSEGNLETLQAYSIDNQWSFQNSNNTIRCQVSIDGIIYEAAEELRFGKGGTNGTEITFLIEFTDNNNAVIAENGSQVSVRARLYDSTGARVGFTEEMANEIKWSWYKRSDDDYIYLPQKLTGDSIILTSNTDIIPQDNYFILQATYNNLTAYLPIPIKTRNTSFIEGAREVIYNHQGVPYYYNDAYVLYYWNNDQKKYEENKGGTWILKYDENLGSQSLTNGYIPILKDLSSRPGYKALSASPFYASGYNDKICVSYINGNYGWSQPILIMQSKYDFAMLNQWDGSLTIDEENGTILSTMLGAGKKNENNTFSGVLIGDIQGGSKLNDTEILTGVYGIHEGVISYALKEDGTATFGKAGRGQILIDGNSSTIQSAQYISNNTGMMLDLDDGVIDIKGSEGERVLLQSESPYFSINTDTTYTDENGSRYFQPLINIGTNSFFIQSDNYTSTNAKGTKLNLQNGNLEIKSPYSRTFLSCGGEGNSNKYFEISVPPLSGNNLGTTTSVDGYTTPLLKISDSEYFLQSIQYDGLQFNTVEINGLTYNLYNNNTVAVSNNGSDIYEKISGNWVQKTFSDSVEIIKTYDKDGEEIEITKTITAEQKKQAYLATLKPSYNQSQGSGLKMDLSRGIINGYNIMLKGTKADDTSKTIIIDSSSSTTPLKIGENFNVNWDGTLSCNKINSLNNDGREQYAVSIGENFYITQGGSAGGSGVSFSGGFSGGFSGIGIGTFKGKGQFDTLVVTGQSNLNSLNVDKATWLKGSLKVGGSVVLENVLQVDKTFLAKDVAIFQSKVTCKNGLEIQNSDSFTSYAKSYLNNEVSCTKGITVTGDSKFNNNLEVSGTSQLGTGGAGATVCNGAGLLVRSGQFETSAGIPAVIGGSITVTGQTQLATNGSTTNCGGNLGVKGQTTILGGLVVSKGLQIGSGDFYIHGNKYSPQDITSTDGTVYAVIGYEKS